MYANAPAVAWAKEEEMRRAVVLLAATALALVVAGGVAGAVAKIGTVVPDYLLVTYGSKDTSSTR